MTKFFLTLLKEWNATQLRNTIYVTAVYGHEMKYRRTGSVFLKDRNELYKANQ